MSVFVTSLNSGSNGNCYYISDGNDAILIDAGLSRRETEKRLKRLGLSLQKVKAIFITHEHGDHIHGIVGICKKYNLPTYLSERTHKQYPLGIPEELFRFFKPYDIVEINGLLIQAVPKLHDAFDPHSFLVTAKGITVGVFTDIGSPCHNTIDNFKKCHVAFLEANYDEDMLENGRYPYSLKNRIRGGYGHLSNRQALKLFVENRPYFMSHLFLSHLSRENNSPELVRTMFTKVAGKTKVIIAGREKETELYQVHPSSKNYSTKPIYSKAVLKKAQLSLF